MANTTPFVVRHYVGNEHPLLKYPGGELNFVDDSDEAEASEALASYCNCLHQKNLQAQALLTQVLSLLAVSAVESGVCCCGTEVDQHTAMGTHEPNDSGARLAERLQEQIQSFLEKD